MTAINPPQLIRGILGGRKLGVKMGFMQLRVIFLILQGYREIRGQVLFPAVQWKKTKNLFYCTESWQILLISDFTLAMGVIGVNMNECGSSVACKSRIQHREMSQVK